MALQMNTNIIPIHPILTHNEEVTVSYLLLNNQIFLAHHHSKRILCHLRNAKDAGVKSHDNGLRMKGNRLQREKTI